MPILTEPDRLGEYIEGGISTIIAKNTKNESLSDWLLKPLDQMNKEVLPFPVEVLPTVLRDQVKNIADFTQTHPDMAAMIMLGVFAICVQGKFVVEGKLGYREPLNLYIAVFAQPGERKSSVMQLLVKDIYQYCNEHNIRLIADDCTPEALIQIMAKNNGTMALVSAEGGMVDQMAGRYSGQPNIDVYLKSHCGDPLCVDRIGREPETISHPTLTIIMASQPEVLSRIMANDTFAGRGLLARFLFALPPSMLGNRQFKGPPFDSCVDDRFKLLLTKLLSYNNEEQPYVITLSQEASVLLSVYFEEHEGYLANEGQAIVDWAAKYIGEILRISGILHLADGNDHKNPVSKETLMSAIKIGQYLLRQAENAYDTIGDSPTMAQAKIILSKIKKYNFRQGRRCELHALCRSRRGFSTAKDMQPALELLEEHGYIRMEEGYYCGRGRKPDDEIIVNPVVFEHK